LLQPASPQLVAKKIPSSRAFKMAMSSRSAALIGWAPSSSASPLTPFNVPGWAVVEVLLAVPDLDRLLALCPLASDPSAGVLDLLPSLHRFSSNVERFRYTGAGVLDDYRLQAEALTKAILLTKL
jgi:hypothetical protein